MVHPGLALCMGTTGRKSKPSIQRETLVVWCMAPGRALGLVGADRDGCLAPASFSSSGLDTPHRLLSGLKWLGSLGGASREGNKGGASVEVRTYLLALQVALG